MSDIQTLEKTTIQVRRDILRMVHKVNSGHPGGFFRLCRIFCRFIFRTNGGYPPLLYGW